jgi:hypothetical protein
VPDRIFIFPSGLLIFIEFKAPGKKTTEKQKREATRLTKYGQLVYLIDDVAAGNALVDRHLQPGPAV